MLHPTIIIPTLKFALCLFLGLTLISFIIVRRFRSNRRCLGIIALLISLALSLIYFFTSCYFQKNTILKEILRFKNNLATAERVELIDRAKSDRHKIVITNTEEIEEFSQIFDVDFQKVVFKGQVDTISIFEVSIYGMDNNSQMQFLSIGESLIEIEGKQYWSFGAEFYSETIKLTTTEK